MHCKKYSHVFSTRVAVLISPSKSKTKTAYRKSITFCMIWKKNKLYIQTFFLQSKNMNTTVEENLTLVWEKFWWELIYIFRLSYVPTLVHVGVNFCYNKPYVPGLHFISLMKDSRNSVLKFNLMSQLAIRNGLLLFIGMQYEIKRRKMGESWV